MDLAENTVTYWPFWLGGLAIGLFVLAYRLGTARMLGVSGGFSDLCTACVTRRLDGSARLPFIVGIVAGGLVAGLATGRAPTASAGPVGELMAMAPPIAAAWFVFGGLLIGFGTALAGGCTSGHGISGLAQLRKSSLLATCTFMAVGMAATWFLFTTLGG